MSRGSRPRPADRGDGGQFRRHRQRRLSRRLLRDRLDVLLGPGPQRDAQERRGTPLRGRHRPRPGPATSRKDTASPSPTTTATATSTSSSSSAAPIPGDRSYNVLFQNPGHGRHWLKVKLVGTRTNRSALGARIQAEVKGPDGRPRSIYRTIGNNGSFGGNTLTETIGLGDATSVAQLTVTWPTSRTSQTFRDVAAGQEIVITEGTDGYKRSTTRRRGTVAEARLDDDRIRSMHETVTQPARRRQRGPSESSASCWGPCCSSPATSCTIARQDAHRPGDRTPLLVAAPSTLAPGVHILGGLKPSAAYVVETSAGTGPDRLGPRGRRASAQVADGGARPRLARRARHPAHACPRRPLRRGPVPAGDDGGEGLRRRGRRGSPEGRRAARGVLQHLLHAQRHAPPDHGGRRAAGR